MTPDEVIEAMAAESGIRISRGTLLNYERQGLIPQPVRSSLGRGKGRTTDYPPNTSKEAATAWKLLNEVKLTPPEIKKARADFYEVVREFSDEPYNLNAADELEIKRALVENGDLDAHIWYNMRLLVTDLAYVMVRNQLIQQAMKIREEFKKETP